MLGGLFHCRRRLAAALALLGVAIYSLILPGHVTSRFEAALFAAEFGQDLGVICRTTPRTTDPSGSSEQAPGMPASDCPICQGLASFQFALEAVELAALAAPDLVADVETIEHPAAAGLDLPHPRSRGPPSSV